MRIEEILSKLGSDTSNDDIIIDTLIYIDDNNIFDEKIVEKVMEIFKKSNNDMVKELVIGYFKRIKSEKLDKELINLFASDRPYLRNAAMEILREKGGEIIPLLMDAMEIDDKDIRKFIIDTVYSIDSPDTVKILKKGLEDKDINVQIAAVEYIGELGISELKEDVLNLFKTSDNMFLKSVCLEALSVIGDGRILQVIKEYFKNNSEMQLLLFPFLKMIENMGSEEDLEYITTILLNYGVTYLKEVINAVEHITSKFEIKVLPDALFKGFMDLLSQNINSIDKYEIIVFLCNFKNCDVNKLLGYAFDSNDKMMILGSLEVIDTKNLGYKFKDKLIELKEKFKDDEEICESIENIFYNMEN